MKNRSKGFESELKSLINDLQIKNNKPRADWTYLIMKVRINERTKKRYH